MEIKANLDFQSLNQEDLITLIKQAQGQLLEGLDRSGRNVSESLKELVESCEQVKRKVNLEALPVWYLESAENTGGALDLIDFAVTLRNRFTHETKEIFESVSPEGFKMCSQVEFDLYGGDHRLQQSILIRFTDEETGEEEERQIEIEHTTGDFSRGQF